MLKNNQIVVIVTEGETDKLFYSKILQVLREKVPGKNFKVNRIDHICVNGIGKFESKLYRIFRKNVEQYNKANKDPEICVFLCYDADVFLGKKNPPVCWKNVEKNLKKYGANKIYHIVANEAIEDFILLDYDGVLKFLKLSKNTKHSYHGVDGLKTLYKMANKAYIKGSKAENLLDSLNFELIEHKLCKQLSYLCEVVGVECSQKEKR